MSLNISLSHSGLLKVIGNGITRSIAYEFLLAFSINCGPILYHFGDKAFEKLIAGENLV